MEDPLLEEHEWLKELALIDGLPHYLDELSLIGQVDGRREVLVNRERQLNVYLVVGLHDDRYD